MGLIVAMVLLAVVLAVVGWLLVSGGLLAKSAQVGTVDDRPPSGDIVRYRVPGGQDPVAVLTALAGSGFHAEPKYDAGEPFVVVPCVRGTPEERDEIRRAIASAESQAHGGVSKAPDVHFEDET